MVDACQEKTQTILTKLRLAIFVVLATHVILTSTCALSYFPTRNEVGHLPAGVSHWDPGVFSIYKVNPPLWRMLAVVPALLLEPKMDSIVVPQRNNQRTEWASAHGFAEDNLADYWKLVQLSRIAGIVWSVLGALILYGWCKRLYGNAPGFIGLVLWCFDPNIIAHASLLTPDLPVTVAAFGATYIFWRYSQRQTWEGALICGIVLGLTQLTKFTALALYPIWAALWIAEAMGLRSTGEQHSKRFSFFAKIQHGALIAVTSLLVINAGYCFEGSFRQLKDYQFVSAVLAGTADAESYGNIFNHCWLGEVAIPLPSDYVEGIDLQRFSFEEKARKSYLAGELKDAGWWYYYLYAFMVKVPVGTITLILFAFGMTVLRRPKGVMLLDDLFIWLPALVIFTFVSSQDGFSRHFRYVLAVFPFLFLGASRLACCFQVSRWPYAFIVGGLLLWSTSSSLFVFPHSLSYFNEIAGGPDNGHKHLANSNIDWGQDLWLLKDWVDKHPEARPISLGYFHFIDYKAITGMDVAKPPSDPPTDLTEASDETLQVVGPREGYFALGVDSLIFDGHSFFLRFRPIAKAGHSIFIYHITLDEAVQARRDMGLPPLRN